MKSITSKIMAAVMIITTTLSHTILSVNALLQCDTETDALLKVSYSNNIEQDDSLDDANKKFTRLAIRPSGNIGNSSFIDNAYYYVPEDFVDYETCIPRAGACLEVTLSNLPLGRFEISWDGQEPVMISEASSQFMGSSRDVFASTEVGDYCSPVCDETTHALFEYQYWSSVGFEDYRVEDMDGNKLLGCDHFEDDCQENTDDSLHTNRVCLPRNSCYRFIVGDLFQRIPGFTDAVGSVSYSLRWDGQLLDKSASKQFDTVLLGASCEPICNTEEESLVEFHMHYITSSYDCQSDDDPDFPQAPPPDFSWELLVYDQTSKSWSLDTGGVIASCTNTSLYHKAICVPKNHCTKFSLSTPEARDFVAPVYSLTMDGVTYRHSDMNIDVYSDFDGLIQETIMGSSCTLDVCEKSNQALFEVEVMTPSEYFHENKTIPAIPESLIWLLSEPHSEDLASPPGTALNYSLPSSAYFDQITMDLGSTYHTIECVPGDECALEFVLTSSVPVQFKLKRNGIELPVQELNTRNVFATSEEECITGSDEVENNPPVNADNASSGAENNTSVSNVDGNIVPSPPSNDNSTGNDEVEKIPPENTEINASVNSPTSTACMLTMFGIMFLFLNQ